MDPKDLPIHACADEIVEALQSHRVIVVEGPTGSGKTTQLPKILRAAGFVHGVIGVTQPRRIAATSVAWRIADELGVTMGQEVGYAIRFDDMTSPSTEIKIMTDGLLLQEARADPTFERYAVVVVDEAHERTLNIDLTLGLLRRALDARDDFRVIVSSATLQPETFQHFFSKDGSGDDVPRVSVDVRMHPIEIRHAPPRSTSHDDLVDAVANEVHALHRKRVPGHVLVFLSGEKLIRNSIDAIMRKGPTRGMAVMPLYGRLKREEQERIFDELPEGERKVILATNIAETSITVPGVCHVIDSGLAKVPFYDGRTGITTLREMGISVASAEQRAGRAGRTGPGFCIRLYSKDSMKKRRDFTEEEILRLDLSEVVLRLLDLGVRDVEDFPFPTAPPVRKLHGSLGALSRLGAIDPARNLTAVGKAMVPFPLGPELARTVVEAALNYPEVLDSVLLVTAWMSVRDPFLFPEGEEMQARRAHDRLRDDRGDALTALAVMASWRGAKERRKYCERNYLEHDTLKFVEKAHAQLRDIAAGIGCEVATGPEDGELARKPGARASKAEGVAVIRCVATGFASQILRKARRAYQTATGTDVVLHPSSALFAGRHDYIVAANLMRTRRVFASQASPVEEAWIPELNPEAAEAWRISSRRKKRDDRNEVEEARRDDSLPENVEVAGRILQVSVRKRSVLVEIPIADVKHLVDAGVTLKAFPPGAERWRGTISAGRDTWLEEERLPVLLAMLPTLRLPKPGEGPLPKDTVPQAALLDHERNLHTIERFLDYLLAPMRPIKGRKPGWLMLVGNGAGGFWYEVTPAFDEALEQTAEGLAMLLDQLGPEDEAFEDVGKRQHAFAVEAETVRDAVRRARKKAKGKGGKSGRRGRSGRYKR